MGFILPANVVFRERVGKGNIKTCSNSHIQGPLDLAEILAVKIGNQVKVVHCFFYLLFQNSCYWSVLIQAILPIILTKEYFLQREP